MISGGLTPGRNHAPVRIISEPLPPIEEATPNIVGIAVDHSSENEYELGSDTTENRWGFFLDIYAESDILGLHLAEDIRALLRGKFHSLGYTDNVLKVYDFTKATPQYIFDCEIEGIEMDKSTDSNKPFRVHWYSLMFTVIDVHWNDAQ